MRALSTWTKAATVAVVVTVVFAIGFYHVPGAVGLHYGPVVIDFWYGDGTLFQVKAGDTYWALPL